jgi:hypothetical protein
VRRLAPESSSAAAHILGTAGTAQQRSSINQGGARPLRQAHNSKLRWQLGTKHPGTSGRYLRYLRYPPQVQGQQQEMGEDGQGRHEAALHRRLQLALDAIRAWGFRVLAVPAPLPARPVPAGGGGQAGPHPAAAGRPAAGRPPRAVLQGRRLAERGGGTRVPAAPVLAVTTYLPPDGRQPPLVLGRLLKTGEKRENPSPRGHRPASRAPPTSRIRVELPSGAGPRHALSLGPALRTARLSE